MTDVRLSADEIVHLSKKFTFFDWAVQDSLPAPIAIARAKGCEFWTADGRRFLDLCSQLWCVNAGHGREEIISAISEQLRVLPYASPFMAHEARALLGAKLASILPGDLNKVFFTLGGAESNEHAIKIARMFTGRYKVLARYRSYHGSTMGAISLTGDPRRWAAEPGLSGVIRAPDFHRWARPEPETAARALSDLEDVIRYEGGHTIAAFILEPIVGANGLLIPPPGYLEGVREVCDRHGILLIADEVMTGFGRTGKWFATEHWGVVPDLLTMSKGLTSGYVPLGAVAVREHVADHFRNRPFMTGLTYNSHPVGCRAALAAIEVYEKDDLVERSSEMGKILTKMLRDLQDRHPCVGAVRNIGLFGAIELVRAKAPYTPLCDFNSSCPEMETIRHELSKAGLYTFQRWGWVFIAPPLVIEQDDLERGVHSIDCALSTIE